MRDAASLLGARAFSDTSLWSQPLLWTVFFGALATLLAVSGPLTFVRKILRKWGIWLLLGACLWLTWNLFSKADLPALWAQKGDGSLPFAVGFDGLISGLTPVLGPIVRHAGAVRPSSQASRWKL